MNHCHVAYRLIHDILMVDDETTLHIDGLEQWCAPVENLVTKIKSHLITDIAWMTIPSTNTVLFLAAFSVHRNIMNHLSLSLQCLFFILCCVLHF